RLLVAGDEVGHRGLLEHPLDGDRHVTPEALEPAPRILKTGVIRGLEAEHREQLPLDRVGDVGHADLRRGAGQATAATGASETLHQPGLMKCPELLLEETEWDALGCRDLSRRHENPVFTAQGEL